MSFYRFFGSNSSGISLDRYKYSYYTNMDSETHFYDIHWHDYYEIEFCVSGNSINRINGTTVFLQRGMLTMLAPGDYHSVEIDPHNNLKYHKLSFTSSVMQKAIRELVEDISFPLVLTFSECELKQLEEAFLVFAELEKENDKNSPLEAAERNNLGEKILLLIIRKALEQASPSEKKYSFNQTDHFINSIQYISDHIAERITLKDIADQAFVSPAYYSRMFHKQTGISVSQYLVFSRMKLAYSMLKTTDMTISDIAIHVGYRSSSLFYKHFQDYFKFSPGAVRKRKTKSKRGK